MTADAERARALLDDVTSFRLATSLAIQAAAVHAVLDLADAIRSTRPTEDR